MDVIIAGCGPSVRDEPGLHVPVDPPEHVYGLNDAMTWMRVDTVQIIDRISRFNRERQAVIRAWSEEDRPRRSRVGKGGKWPRLSEDHDVFTIEMVGPWNDRLRRQEHLNLMPTYKTSLVCALWGVWKFVPGTERVGIIGCDMVGHKVLQRFMPGISRACKTVINKLHEKGIEVVNLSPLEQGLEIPKAPRVAYRDWSRGLQPSVSPG